MTELLRRFYILRAPIKRLCIQNGLFRLWAASGCIDNAKQKPASPSAPKRKYSFSVLRFILIGTLILIILFYSGGCFNSKPMSSLSGEKYTRQKAIGMIRTSRTGLAPVYAPLAEQIVSDFDLNERKGIGIDLGSGPGTLIVELCKRTRMHWINADINPNYFPNFYRLAEENNVGQQVSAIFADAHSLPFRDNYADMIVSRGSYHFWEDKVRAFREIYRVLKPGAAAYIGRGFSRDLPIKTAKKIRAKQGKKMKYNLDEKAKELENIMNELGIKEYRIDIPKPKGSDNINYGIWIEFHKS